MGDPDTRCWLFIWTLFIFLFLLMTVAAFVICSIPQLVFTAVYMPMLWAFLYTFIPFLKTCQQEFFDERDSSGQLV